MTILTRVLEIWKKGLSMVVKTLILTGVAGLSSWWVMDYLLNERIGVLFSRHFLELMEQQASKDRQLLHEFLSFHSWAVTLFVRQENFFHHLENYHNAGWSLEDSPKVIYHNQKPSWLPGRSVTRKMAYATHVALLDGEFRLREVYAQVPPPMSEEDLNELLVHNSKEHGQNTLTEVNGVLNLVTTAALQDQNGDTMGWLVFISPMNDELLFLFQQQYRSMGIAAFIDNKDDKVVASSRPELVAKGSTVSQLQRNYHISGKKFLDHGFSADATVRFVTLIPLSQLDDLSDSVLAEERTYRGIAHVVLTMVFLAIAFWISRRIELFIERMQHFAKSELGIVERHSTEGDQLELLKEQFHHMAQEIVFSRQRDMSHARELEETNQALSSSLEMVQRAQAQLVQSEKLAALGGMVAGIAHEINTPAGIAFTSSNHLEEETKSILERYKSGELRRNDLEEYFTTASEAVGLIQNNLGRANQLIRNFKMVAVDQASNEKRVFNLKNYLDGVVQSLRPKWKNSGITITVECPLSITVDSIPGAFSQIFTNLIINSLTHAFGKEDTGMIHIGVEEKEEEWIIRYHDDGRGIPPDHLNRIFEPFFTTIRGKGGSGLGLHIVHNLVSQTLKGSISCSSEPGQGTTFTIQLPKDEWNVVA